MSSSILDGWEILALHFMCSESSPLQVERKYEKEEMLDEIEGVEMCMGIGARQAEEQQKYHGPLVTILHGPTRPI